jgi:hypothetical protein
MGQGQQSVSYGHAAKRGLFYFPHLRDGEGTRRDATLASAPANFEEWLEGQDDATKGLVEGHASGLKSALDSERSERKKLARQLNDLAGKAEKGSEAQKQLEEISGQLTAADQRADFFEAASVAGITGSSLKLAWLAASGETLEDFTNARNGRVDYTGLFEQMKTDYPNLFSSRPATPPAGNAGSGTQTPPAPAMDMNQLILKAAGRK